MSDDEADDDGNREIVPECPNGLMIFPKGSVVVTDADEEILELYMNLASTKDDNNVQGQPRSSGGLGFLDSSSSLLELELILRKPDLRDHLQNGVVPSTGHNGRRRKTGKKESTKEEEEEVKINVKVQQDLMALKGRKGDTGSVLWRSSLYLARHLLSQNHYAPINPLFNLEALRNARILELGAGTGLLAVLLSSLCNEYTASDRLENLKLVQRNLEINGRSTSSPYSIGSPPTSPNINPKIKKGTKGPSLGQVQGGGGTRVLLEEVDWVAISEKRRRTTRSISSKPIKSPVTSSQDDRPDGSSRSTKELKRETPDSEGEGKYDLVLAVDCIYNENLVQPLVDTLHAYCPRGGKTIVWVVVELRSSDVLTMFLDAWLNDSPGEEGGWTIVRIPAESMGEWDGTSSRWVGWVGWR